MSSRRIDPYKNYKFVIGFEGEEPFIGVTKIGPLKKTREVIDVSEGGEPLKRKAAGAVKYESITVERGITYQKNQFEDWADKEEGEPRFRRNLYIVFRDENNRPVYRYNLKYCWISEYTALPELDAGGNALAIESLTIQLDKWERDKDAEPPPNRAIY